MNRSIDLTDEEFILGFEDATFPITAFHHREHIRAAWFYLNRMPVLDALVAFTQNLKQFAAANGKSEIYHETITYAFVFILNERLQRSTNHQTFEEFANDNADLFNWKDNPLRSYYSDERLNSDFARKVFVFPDRAPHSLC